MSKDNKQSSTGESSTRRGRPVKNDIMHLQRSIPATPEQLAKAVLNPTQRKGKD